MKRGADDSAPLSTSDEDVSLALRCTEVVLRDLEVTTGTTPTATVDRDEWHGGVRIVLNGGYTAPSMTADDPADALVEVADYIQSQMAQDIGYAWPVCRLHEAGLHACLDGRVPCWRCPAGHVVAPIGELPSTSQY